MSFFWLNNALDHINRLYCKNSCTVNCLFCNNSWHLNKLNPTKSGDKYRYSCAKKGCTSSIILTHLFNSAYKSYFFIEHAIFRIK